MVQGVKHDCSALNLIRGAALQPLLNSTTSNRLTRKVYIQGVAGIVFHSSLFTTCRRIFDIGLYICLKTFSNLFEHS